jgi:hypothetical protein
MVEAAKIQTQTLAAGHFEPLHAVMANVYHYRASCLNGVSHREHCGFYVLFYYLV